MKQTRNYQKKALDSIDANLKKGINKNMVVMATGCGKTFTAVKAVSPFKKRLWITHEENLLEQSGIAFLNELMPSLSIQTMIDTYGGLYEYISAVKKIDMFSSMSENDIIKNIGLVKADVFDIEADIVMASAQTLYKRLNKITPDYFDAIVADECHLFASKTYSEPLKYFNPKLLLGITATPYRMDGANLGDIFNEICFQYNIAEAIADGYLCELDALAIKSTTNLDKVHTLGGDFNQRELREQVNTPERNQLLLDKYRQYANGKQNIVFCVDTEHAQDVCNLFKENGESAELLVSDKNITTDRKGLVNRFKNGETRHLINIDIATLGFDYPGIGVVTLARPTKSLTKYMQMLGRGTRTLSGVIDGIESAEDRKIAIKNSNKPNAIILDIVDNIQKNTLINTWTLDSGKKIEDRVFITSEKKEKLISERKKREFDALTKQDRRVNLFKLPEVKLSTRWDKNDIATERQLAVLKGAGYDIINNTYTKISAHDIISNFPAKSNVIGLLKFKGYDVSSGVTYAESLLAFKEIEKRESKEKIQKEVKNINSIISDIE